MERKQNRTMLKLRREINNCELCGSSRNLEVHHIIPVVFGGPEDDEENMIVVCKKCHALLTPHRILSKEGIKRAMAPGAFSDLYREFYETLGEFEGDFDKFDMFDLFDDLTNKYSKKYCGQPANNAEYHGTLKGVTP